MLLRGPVARLGAGLAGRAVLLGSVLSGPAVRARSGNPAGTFARAAGRPGVRVVLPATRLARPGTALPAALGRRRRPGLLAAADDRRSATAAAELVVAVVLIVVVPELVDLAAEGRIVVRRVVVAEGIHLSRRLEVLGVVALLLGPLPLCLLVLLELLPGLLLARLVELLLRALLALLKLPAPLLVPGIALVHLANQPRVELLRPRHSTLTRLYDRPLARRG